MANRQKPEDTLIVHPKTKIVYKRGILLGKGGFAKCFEFKDLSSNILYAGKVVSKKILTKPHHREKMFQEIQIHKTLSHKYIVSLYSYFEDDDNVYIILELCRKRSLTEMHKRRKILTMPEVRYFMHQIILACKYMHDNKVIHRDLKLGNLFINDDMEIKVGDFGLATQVCFEGERKKTLCGTPNYIAPEILTKAGHSYEVDMWSVGCIMYTLLVGQPPFETSNLRNTYSKIKKNDYVIPSSLDPTAKSLIKRLLHPEPSCRPNADQVLEDDFFMIGYLPSSLPNSCLHTEPRNTNNVSVCQIKTTRKPLVDTAQLDKVVVPTNVIEKADFEIQTKTTKDFYLKDLLKLITKLVNVNLDELHKLDQEEDAQDPALVPFVWISKWVDYTDKYGMGYQLCDNSIGVSFNDQTHLILLADGKNFEYIDGECKQYCSLENYPKIINKKVTILNYFNTYMNENLLKAGESATPRDGDELTQLPHLRAWFRTKSAIVFHLTNGTFQANFFRDHTKIIICPIMSAVSFIDEDKNFTVYSMELLEQYGCSHLLYSRLKYSKQMIEKLYTEFHTVENINRKK